MQKKIAVLLACHNRRDNTSRCLHSLYLSEFPREFHFDVFLVDDGSTDGTTDAIKEHFPNVHITQGTGSLYWAGGMRLAWRSALEAGDFDAFLLLNDDVELQSGFVELFVECHSYALAKYGVGGVYSAATIDRETGTVSYGARKILKGSWRVVSRLVETTGAPQEVDIVNGNVLWIEQNVYKKIGMLDESFTHGIADFDYSLRAKEAKLPVLLASAAGGNCVNDHKKNYLGGEVAFRERVNYLKSPIGLAYNEYLHYIRRHFPFSLPYAFLMLWAKTVFPYFWNRFRQ